MPIEPPSRAEEAPRAGRVLVLATRNVGKARELRALLGGLDVDLRTLDQYPAVPPLPEPGETFVQNATSKAATVAGLTGEIALADDSGLDVDALGGAPGVHSATILGPDATDEDRYRWVLDRLQGVEDSGRGARFRAVVAVARPDGEVRTFEGTCEGRVASGPRGAHGFGYDPIFYLPEYGQTMAELAPETKNRISHRRRALDAALHYLRELLAR
jgi:XTP/dITP diphosphohydrolase